MNILRLPALKQAVMRMNNYKSRRLSAGIGISSLIIIFVALAVAVFSVLTLLTVRQDLNSARLSCAAQEQYYAADTKATEQYAKLSVLCGDESVIDLQQAAAELGISVKRGRGENNAVVFTWSVSVNEDSSLKCSAAYSGGKLTITEWRTVNNMSYINENSLPVWNGENLP